MQRVGLLSEFFLIFIVLPLLFLGGLLGNEMIMPVLWIVFAYTLVLLRRSGKRLFDYPLRRRDLIRVFKRYLVILPGLLLLSLALFPQNLFDFPRKEPVLWSILMVAYPLVSAFVQEVIFRTFFFWRYRPLFSTNGAAILINAVLFSYTHAVFMNPVAVVLSFIGGFLFAFSFKRSRSLLLVFIEHTLYGNTLFTIGLGSFFYHRPLGEIPLAEIDL